MIELDEIINKIEEQESYSDMHFSLYSIPSYYNEEEPTFDKSSKNPNT